MRNQSRAPLAEALEEVRRSRLVPFDVPGHKRGFGNPDLTDFLGSRCLSVDVNSMKPLDNLMHPDGVIKEAEETAAEAFNAAHAFFMVGGTTSAVQAMIWASVRTGDEIILPRNVHQSVLNALVLCGAVPVYINPKVLPLPGIAAGMTVNDLLCAVKSHPNAKAVFINNPTYYGICSDLKQLTETAHRFGLTVLVDEAHGAHFHFGENLPISAMDAGADLSAVSMHKSGGSLTQSSLLLCGKNVNADRLLQVINLTQTTSASYLLLASLDISRRNLALHGKEIFKKTVDFAAYAREEINAIGEYYAYGKELIDGESVFDFDETKLAVNTLGIGLSGIEVYDLLRDDFDIQIEFGDLGNILAYISVGDKSKNIERLIGALDEIRRLYKKPNKQQPAAVGVEAQVVLPPQAAFFAEKESIPLNACAGRVCAEFVMSYPPGIPILAPGEAITEEIIGLIRQSKEKGCLMTGAESPDLSRLNVLKGERHG